MTIPSRISCLGFVVVALFSCIFWLFWFSIEGHDCNLQFCSAGRLEVADVATPSVRLGGLGLSKRRDVRTHIYPEACVIKYTLIERVSRYTI